MSYILDAVRKAEEERQESESIGVRSLAAQVPLADTRKKPSYWLVAAACLLLGNTALWISVADNEEGEPSTMPANAASINPVPQQVTTLAKASDELAKRNIDGAGIDVAGSDSAATEKLGAQPQEIKRLKLWQASSSAQTVIGSLEFSFHVYSTEEKRRTIIIDQQRMREGDRISEALRLEEITETGVLLAFEDSLVEVDILEQW